MNFEADMMDDLFSDAAEGAAGFEDDDEMDEGSDDFDDLDALDSGSDDLDALDAMESDSNDSVEDAVADALAADDTDEFFRRLRRIARQVAPVVARVARVIPHPAAQAVSRIASVVGRLAADGADEFEALDDMFALADEGESIDALAPFVAGLAVRSSMRRASRLPQQQRRALVRGVARATRTLARRQGPAAVRAVPQVVRVVQRGVARRQIASRAVPRAIQTIAARAARSSRVLRRLIQAAAPLARRTPGGVAVATRGPGRGCSRYRVAGPVTITIRGS